MKHRIVLAGALLVVCSLAAFAQQEPPKMSAEDAAMMEAMMKAGTPGEPHQKLGAMAGTWNAKVTSWGKPGAEPMVMNGTAEIRLVMGGRYLEQRFTSSFMGMPFEGLGYTGYDNVKKQYWSTWLDNMSTSMMSSTGSTSDGKTYTFVGSMPDPMTGKDTRVDEKLTITDADHHVMEMWSPGPDGKVFKMMEISYARKK